MHYAIFTSPFLQKGAYVSDAIKMADKIIAADCGAMVALDLGIVPEAVIGDFDSLDTSTIKKLEKQQVQLVRTPPEKDEVDTQLAIEYAIQQGATRISLVGGIEGNRIDHALANISLTYNPKIPIYLVNGPSKSWVALGPATIQLIGEKDDLLSLIPLSQVVTNITTSGLYYPLLNEPLYFGVPRGISNVFAEKEAKVSFGNGMLLFVQTHKKEIILASNQVTK